MASNFEIAVDKNSDVYTLKLVGDFDATSAYELIYASRNCRQKPQGFPSKRMNWGTFTPLAWMFFADLCNP